LRRRDRAGLTRFVRTLAAALPTGRTVSVDVSNMTEAAQFNAAGYDLRALGRAADEIVLMGYDQHGTWENVPGPVGALAWQRAGLKVVLAAVPRRKVTLGVAGYGYAWRPHANVYVSDRRARELVRSGDGHARFNSRVGEWTARLADGSTLWWSDARSLALRAQLATRLHLHGLAVWSLGLSDPVTA
jgi:spore germination protein YaaH